MAAKIYPIKLATVFQCDYSHNVLNTRFGEKIDTAILSFLIFDGKNLVLFDTGQRRTAIRGDPNLNMIGDAPRCYREKFDALGIGFDRVTHIVLSHLHWDHIENNDLFPYAKVYIQRSEMAYAAAPEYDLYYENEDIGRLLIDDYHRIEYLDGDYQLTPNIRLVLMGGHTPGSQGALITTPQGVVGLPGDNCNLYENIDTRSVKELNVVEWVRSMKRMRQEADIILPNHEPKVLDDYPEIG
jgi:glyoxylase-like metal-dependent hydrolase (beta-lactamase superfamily II)